MISISCLKSWELSTKQQCAMQRWATQHLILETIDLKLNQCLR